jgi:hypothetical protein
MSYQDNYSSEWADARDEIFGGYSETQLRQQIRQSLLSKVDTPNNYNKKSRVKKGGRSGCKKTEWMKHLDRFRKEHPNVKGKQVFIQAKKTYKK